jgi:hypothetical protein
VYLKAFSKTVEYLGHLFLGGSVDPEKAIAVNNKGCSQSQFFIKKVSHPQEISGLSKAKDFIPEKSWKAQFYILSIFIIFI